MSEAVSVNVPSLTIMTSTVSEESLRDRGGERGERERGGEREEGGVVVSVLRLKKYVPVQTDSLCVASFLSLSSSQGLEHFPRLRLANYHPLKLVDQERSQSVAAISSAHGLTWLLWN